MKSEKPQMIVGFCDPLSGNGLWSADETNMLQAQMMHAGLANQVSLLGSYDEETASIADFAVSSAPVALPAVMGFAGAWVQAKFGRKVRVKKGDLEIEAGSVEEVELLLEKVSKPAKADKS
jgi:hypothetical protein